MPHTKIVQSKKKIKAPTKSPDVVEDIDEILSDQSPKTKKVIEIVDIHDDISGIVEEKPEVDPLLGEEETDESAAEEVLDDDEVNPFGDKWEV